MDSWNPPNRYKDVRPFAQGGMGQLYAARDAESGRDVVIKRPRQDTQIAVDRLEQRFRREQDLLLSVSHVHVVKVVEVGRHDAQLFIATELVDGVDLRTTLDQSGSLPLTETIRILDSVCRAVSHLHRKGILHRDLQPGNVLLGSDGAVKVTDFGIAVPLDGLGRMTQTGEVLGTADYMSPEQRHRLPMDERSDQYSIGAIAYEMLTGQRATGLFKPPSAVNPTVPESVDSVVMRSLCRDPEERFETVDEFREHLEMALQRSTANQGGRRKRHVIAALLLVAAINGLGLFWFSDAATSENGPSTDATSSSKSTDEIRTETLQKPNPIRSIESSLEREQVRRLQRRWAAYLSLPVVSENSIGMKLALIPPGEFLMGATEDDVQTIPQGFHRQPTDGSTMLPRHPVTVSRAFLIGQHEVTVSQFRQFVEDQDYLTEAETGFGRASGVPSPGAESRKFNWRDPGYKQSDDHPVVNVTWHDAVAFCEWISQKEGDTYRLPTEAETEYVIRAGTQSAWWFGDSFALAPGNSAKQAELETAGTVPAEKVADTGEPNGFGLFDVAGNVSEWCLDVYNPGAYTAEPAIDPLILTGPDIRRRVVRGSSAPWFQRSAVRCQRPSNVGLHHLGFRVVRELNGDSRGDAPSSQPPGISFRATR